MLGKTVAYVSDMYYVYRFRNQPENTDCHNILTYQDDERCYEQKDPVCINLFVSKYKPFIWIVDTRVRGSRTLNI